MGEEESETTSERLGRKDIVDVKHKEKRIHSKPRRRGEESETTVAGCFNTIIKEMADSLSLSLVDKDLVTNSITLTIMYDNENIKNGYSGIIKKDYYGRDIPKEFHKSISLDNVV